MFFTKLSAVLLCFCCFAFCTIPSSDAVMPSKKTPHFEGEIKFIEFRSFEGKPVPSFIKYHITENMAKREQRLSGAYAPLNETRGIIIDLKKDSVTLYYTSLWMKKKHTLSIKTYEEEMWRFVNQVPSPIDFSFTDLHECTLQKEVNDSTTIKDFSANYSLYMDSTALVERAIFDTDDITINRKFLSLFFYKIPDNINFPLKTTYKTNIYDIPNDTLINSKVVSNLDKLTSWALSKVDSTKERRPLDPKKLAKSKLFNWGLNAMKKGIDLALYHSTTLSSLSPHAIGLGEFTGFLGDFESVDDFDDFVSGFSGGDFDD